MTRFPNKKSVLKRSVLGLFLLLLFSLGAPACTATQKIDFTPGTVHFDKHPVRVALVLNKTFSEASEKRVFIYPLGVYLTPYAHHVSQQAFSRVTEYDTLEAAMKCPDADAVLEPRFVKLEVRSAGMAWDPRHALVVLEWKLKNIKNQKTVWLATVEGRADGNVGSGIDYGEKDRKAMQEALDDMYSKTAEAFNKSDEIQAFAKTVKH